MGAARAGQLDAVRLLLDLNAENEYIAFNNAAAKGQCEVIKLFASYQRNDKPIIRTADITTGLGWAASNGELDAIRLLVKLGAAFDYALREAASNGKLSAIRLLIELGATNLNDALWEAANCSRLKAVKLLIELGATDIQNALAGAIESRDGYGVKTARSTIAYLAGLQGEA